MNFFTLEDKNDVFIEQNDVFIEQNDVSTKRNNVFKFRAIT